MSKGLTLIESLISIAIVIFGISFITLVLPLAVRKTDSNEVNNAAFFLASARMEEAVSLNYRELEEGVSFDNYGNYEIETKVSCFHPERDCSGEETGIKKIEVDISLNSSTKSIINLSTLVIKE